MEESQFEDILTNGIAGSLHCFFEGYFMIHHDHMASAQDLFGQLWKEYALSDSRYMTSDTLVLCMETITVVSPTISL
jgi:cholestenol delta-isomerase